MVDNESLRDHLFISYAGEDFELTEWLTLKLTSEGYKVWCDKIKLLGGESYPLDIDDAIKNKTFRMLALLSHNSIRKPNPMKERTMALNLMRERKEELLIPLNVDGLSPTEIDWMQNDITFISFNQNWAEGLKQLLKKLDSVSAPRPLQDGKEIAANYFLKDLNIKTQDEEIYSNCLRIKRIPSKIKKFKFNEYVSTPDLAILARGWAFYKKSKYYVFSFQTPPKMAIEIEHVEDIDWNKEEEVDGIYTKNIVQNLLKKALEVKLYERGLKREIKIDENGKKKNGRFYFPFDPLQKNQLHFKSYTGKNTYILICSTRRKGKIDGTIERYNYHVAPKFSIRRDFLDNFLILLKIELHLTNEDDEAITKRSYLSRRKIICKSWWNHQWLIRNIAVIQYLAEFKDDLIIGTKSEEQIVVNAKLERFISPISIIEKPSEEELIDESDDVDIGIDTQDELEVNEEDE